MFKSRIAWLEAEIAKLQTQIQSTPVDARDSIEFNQIVQKKLALKDELGILRRRQWEHDHETVNLDDEQ